MLALFFSLFSALFAQTPIIHCSEKKVWMSCANQKAVQSEPFYWKGKLANFMNAEGFITTDGVAIGQFTMSHMPIGEIGSESIYASEGHGFFPSYFFVSSEGNLMLTTGYGKLKFINGGESDFSSLSIYWLINGASTSLLYNKERDLLIFSVRPIGLSWSMHHETEGFQQQVTLQFGLGAQVKNSIDDTLSQNAGFDVSMRLLKRVNAISLGLSTQAHFLVSYNNSPYNNSGRKDYLSHGQIQVLGLLSPVPYDDWQNFTITAGAQYLLDESHRGSLSFPIGLSYQF
jgi:hypothetical protein